MSARNKEPLGEPTGVNFEAAKTSKDQDREREEFAEVKEVAAALFGETAATVPSQEPIAPPPTQPVENPPAESNPSAGDSTTTRGMPTFIHPNAFSSSSDDLENRLQSRLNDSDFLDAVWHRMDGPFNEAARHLVDYLTRSGMAEPQVAPYPEITRKQLNHWRMMVVASQEPGSKATRILVPRHYDRYDPTLHHPLFILQGDPAAADKHLRELRRCVLLRAQGDLGQSVADRVLEKGIVVV